MKGSWYIGEKYLRAYHGQKMNGKRKNMVVEIPERLFHAINKAREMFVESGDKRTCPFSRAITELLRAPDWMW